MEHIHVDTMLGYAPTDEEMAKARHIVGKVRVLCKTLKGMHAELVSPADTRYSQYHKLITEYQLDLADIVGMRAAATTIAELWNGLQVIN